MEQLGTCKYWTTAHLEGDHAAPNCIDWKPLPTPAEPVAGETKIGRDAFTRNAYEYETPVPAVAAPAEGKCNQPAGNFIPRLGLSFACALPKGHEGDHEQGGNCLKHGEYIGKQCPQWPDCISAATPPPAATVPDFSWIARATERIAKLQHMGVERGLEFREHKIAAIIREEWAMGTQ